ncbi:MAG: DUF3617 domain-containing protein [Geminicoccaceae bacterium]
MKHRHIAWAALMIPCLGSLSHAGELQLEKGLYDVRFRIELPHLEQYAVDRKTTICVDRDQLKRQELPVPLLSQNDIFSACRIDNVREDGAGFSYDIVCAGRGSGRATATYVTAPDGFRSRISITQGGKNMTMTEVQRGRRVGDCDPPM